MLCTPWPLTFFEDLSRFVHVWVMFWFSHQDLLENGPDM